MASQRSGRRTNIRKRGSTYTYYLHVPDGRGGYRQISKGGFTSQREAEAARIEAQHAIQTGTYVKPERLTLGEFLTNEWLPSRSPRRSRRAPTRRTARSSSCTSSPASAASPSSSSPPSTSTASTASCSTAAASRRSSPPAGTPMRSTSGPPSCAARAAPTRSPQACSRERVPRPRRHDHPPRRVVHLPAQHGEDRGDAAKAEQGLSPRTVRYIHSILHAALKDALRWNRIVRNLADAATPPSGSLDEVGAARHVVRRAARRASSSSSPTVPLPPALAVPRHQRLPARRVPRPQVGRHRPRDGHRRASPARCVTDQREHAGQGAAEDQARPHDHPRPDDRSRCCDRGERRRTRSASSSAPATRTTASCSAKADGTAVPPRAVLPRVRPQAGALQPRPTPTHHSPASALHGLRHTWATLALGAGIDIKIVSDRLNHCSTHITREIYTHVTPPMQSDAAERVARQIFGSRSSGRSPS